MIQKLWVSENRKTLVCVDSYDNGVLQGRFYNCYQDMVCFESLSQFLIRMESALDEQHEPQAYMSPRTFSEMPRWDEEISYSAQIRKGALATFELQLIFRQNTSWQGVIVWKDRAREKSFRSVLELIVLLDSALRTDKGGENHNCNAS